MHAQAMTFDTHVFIKRLVAVGMTEAQAEVISEQQRELVEDRLATHEDMVKLEKEIKQLTAHNKRDLQELEQRLTYSLTVRMGLMTTATITIIAALVKLL